MHAANESRVISHESLPAYLQRAQERHDVLARLRIAHLHVHRLPGNELLRLGEPGVERLLVPDDGRALQRRGIVEALARAGLAAEHAAVRWADAVVVDRVAAHAARFVQRLAVDRVTGR